MSNPVPMFSQRHYEAVAAIVARHYNAYTLDYAARAAVRVLAEDMLHLFAGDNPRFNRDRFLQACGLEK